MEEILKQRIEELEKRVAVLEGRVPEQPKNETIEDIIKKQISILQIVQERCMNRDLYGYIALIAKEISTLIILSRNLPYPLQSHKDCK